MGFKVLERGDVTLIEIGGELIVGNRQLLKEQVLEQLERGGRKFIVDFSNTDYID
ncbi:MAG TPA: anti-sigma factor antagonist, partial [Gemmatimonadetes bacterium]|nr:anti-sigma factor antagonist [Gemmatimonadota bacterium]